MNRHFASSLRTAGLFLTVIFSLAGVIQAQEVAAGGCRGGWSSFGALGITGFTCDCTLSRKEDVATWSFRGEPVINAITPGGPASGKLREGDVIVAIDGLLITTRAAGDKVSSLRAGESVVLTIRRNGRVQQVEIETVEDCADEAAPALASTPPAEPGQLRTARPGRPPRQPRPPVAAVPEAPMTPAAPGNPLSAWFGFGISCHDCSARATRDGELWDFSEYPTIYSVDPGSPAERAGLRRGDVLMKIDAADLLESEGARRFGNIEPGQSVTWSFRRGGTTRAVRVTAAEPPGKPADLAELRTAIDQVRLRQRAELDAEMDQYRGNLARAERYHSDSGRRDLEAARAAIDSLRQSQGARMDEYAQRLRETVARIEEESAIAPPAIAGTDRQHLRFAGMVGNTNVEVRGLSSVDVSYDEATGELLIRTVDSTIRVKAPTNR